MTLKQEAWDRNAFHWSQLNADSTYGAPGPVPAFAVSALEALALVGRNCWAPLHSWGN